MQLHFHSDHGFFGNIYYMQAHRLFKKVCSTNLQIPLSLAKIFMHINKA